MMPCPRRVARSSCPNSASARSRSTWMPFELAFTGNLLYGRGVGDGGHCALFADTSSECGMSMLLAENVAVVTGASSGIGRAIALAFATEGARVVLADLV